MSMGAVADIATMLAHVGADSVQEFMAYERQGLNPKCFRQVERWYQDGHECCTGSDMLGCSCPRHLYDLMHVHQTIAKERDEARMEVARLQASMNIDPVTTATEDKGA